MQTISIKLFARVSVIKLNVLATGIFLTTSSALATVRYVWQDSATPGPPYTNWTTAAHVIQDAVDAGGAGDLILVTNGLYQTGGRVGNGMNNRVAVAKALTVQSVNGPGATTIAGYQVPGTTNGAAAVRCVFLADGAVLAGFTLTNGATHSSDYYEVQSGGGAWCESDNAVLTNCVLTGNSAFSDGGGVNHGTLKNCALIGNSASFGGGACNGTLSSCTLTENLASGSGGGAVGGTLNNCTLTGNSAQYSGGGASQSTLHNCIVYYNTARVGDNYDAATLNYCCTTPLPSSGADNFTAEPQLAGNWHLSAGSPCRGTGSAAYATGLDLEDEPWASPPSIGCDESWSGSVTGALNTAIMASYTNVVSCFEVAFHGLIEGRVSASSWDFGDGAVVSNRPYATHAWAVAGDYVVELRAYNESYPEGVVANLKVHVAARPVHYVALDSPNPVVPYDSWATAASSIQEAVDVAMPGALVVVSNGTYEVGEREVYGMPNRVAVTKPVTVRSVNGPEVTTIAGYQVPGTTNGDGAVRCVYLTNGAVMAGFTLVNGATQTSGDAYKNSSGGGVWCDSTRAVLTNCVLTGNSANYSGGGAYLGTLNNCTLTNNSAWGGGGYGGGAYRSTLNNCTLGGNSAWQSGGGAFASTLSQCTLTTNSAWYGGGAHSSTLNNCTVKGNSAQYGGGACLGTLNNCALEVNSAWLGGAMALYGTLNNCTLLGNSAAYGGGAAGRGTGPFDQPCVLNNSIVYYNTSRVSGDNYDTYCTFNQCCTTPLPSSGTNNFNAEPQLAGDWHLSAGSPCRSAGSVAYASGLDLDGEPWASPPSIGCDEYWSGSVTGALSAGILASYTNIAVQFAADFQAVINGQVSASSWDFGDGVVVSNRPFAKHAWSQPGAYVVELRVCNETTSATANVTVHVLARPVLYVAVESLNPLPPYDSWARAASTIQEAVDAATPGALVLVSNGVYHTGTQDRYGMAHRVAVTTPITVQSVNGPELTTIDGADGAVRCVYLTDGAVLAGFTVANGATQAWGDEYVNQSGGGVWCESVRALLTNCVLTGNSASWAGGAAYLGTLSNCSLVTNTAWNGGGACLAVLNNCTLASNSAHGLGGGAYLGTLDYCRLTGNSADTGGGAYGSTLSDCTLTDNLASGCGGGASEGTLHNCTLTGNSASQGGGAMSGTLNNCALTGNAASYGGGAEYGTLTNCTLTGNSADYGGGAHQSKLRNCIVFYNTARITGDNYDADSTLNYCCTTPLPSGGTGNLTAQPQLASSTHLSAGSPCRGAGSAAYASGLDLDGEPWASPPSIGCDEYWSGSVTGGLSAGILASYTNVAAGFEVEVHGLIEGRVSASRWDFGDGAIVSNRPYATHAWAVTGDYVVELRAYSESYPEGVAANLTVHVAAPPTHYVALDSLNPVAPYDSWATAACSIQEAVDVAMPGALVVVSNGTYEVGEREVYGMANRVAVTGPVTVQSVNGPEVTTIAGYQVPGTTNGDGAVRCVYLTSGAVLAGFTLTNGATQTSGDFFTSRLGGGVWCESARAVLTNCVLTGNSASSDGGGACFGTLNNCRLMRNSANDGGGGAYSCTLNRCMLAANSARYGGGGAQSCTLNDCVLSGNLADGGGGACVSSLNNCTITGNSANSGGGVYYGTLNNCVVYFNTGGNYDADSTLSYSCTTPLPDNGVGNIANAPLFVDRASGNLHLQSNSPCINAGLNAYAAGPTDLDGNPRIVSGTVDIGAYEFQAPGSVISYAWLQQYGLPSDGSADFTDPDRDGLNTWQEWRCGTCPTNALSVLRLVSAAPIGTNVTVTWQSVAGVSYFLECCTSLSPSPLFTPLATGIPGQPGTTTYTDTTATNAGPYFYRVGVGN
jgi:hypothetical protein